MTADENRLLEIAASVSDGSEVDWAGAERSAEGEGARRALRQLRLLAAIGRLADPSPPVLGEDAHPAPAADRTRTLPALGGGGARGVRRPVAPASEALSPTSASAPTHWGHLEILELAGSGAFGDVYRAWDTLLDREVALKLLRLSEPPAAKGASGDPGRILAEGRLLARVRHPSVVQVYGADTHDGRVGIWMEFVRGATLEDLLAERGPFGAGEAALIGRDLCRALSAVHGLGLVHRDVKTRNVMREEGGRIVLMDFGLGSESSEGSAGATPIPAGTPLFMAPEVLRGEAPSPGSDLYALGVILFRLVTGRYPVEGDTPAAIAARHEAGRMPPLRDLRPDLPEAFVSAVERLLARVPAERFASAGEADRALAGASPAGPGPGEDAPPATRAPSRRGSPPRRLLVAAGVVLLLAAAAAGSRSLRGLLSPADAAYAIDVAFRRVTPGGSEPLVPGSRITPGDELFMELRGSRSLYAYVLNEDDRGNAFLLFPLPGYELSNPLPSGRLLKLPGRREGVDVRWQVTSAGGQEHFLVVTSPRPVPEFESEVRALPRPEVGRPVVAAPMNAGLARRLRGVGGLTQGPEGAGSSDSIVSRIADLAQRLGGREETTRGIWMRRIDLENPGQ